MPADSACDSIQFQATVAWKWYNYFEAQLPADRAILKINLDETSVCLFQGGAKGNLLLSKAHLQGRRPRQGVPRGKTRTYLTHIAFVCDCPAIQQVLPQIVIGNEATFPASAMPGLRAACPSYVRLVRQKSSWNNRILCAAVVRILAAALRPYRDRFQPVLLSDTVRFHFADTVLQACSNNGIWPMLVPAKTTWLLQPLDTHVFRAFKSALGNFYQEARIRAGRCDLNIGQFLACLYEAMHAVLQSRSWSHAFAKNGFGSGQAGVSGRIMCELGIAAPVLVPATRPTRDELQCVFPARTTIPQAALWRVFDSALVGQSSASGGSAHIVKSTKVVAEHVPLLGRTRSEHKQALAAQAQAASSSAGHTEAIAISPVVAQATRLGWYRKPKAPLVAEIL